MAVFPLAVPIIGAPFKLMLAYSTAVIQCNCEAQVVLMLPGKNAVVTCPACQNHYVIAKSGEIQVGQLHQRPDGAVQ